MKKTKKGPSRDPQKVTPYLLYKDVAKHTFYGDRRYGAEDPEGHQWHFAEHVRDVTPEEMKKAAMERE